MPLISVRRADPIPDPLRFVYPPLIQDSSAIYVAVDQQAWLMTIDQAQHYVAKIKCQLTAAKGTPYGISISDTNPNIIISPEGAERLVTVIQEQLQAG